MGELIEDNNLQLHLSDQPFEAGERTRAKWKQIGFLRVELHGFRCKGVRTHRPLPRPLELHNHASVALPSADMRSGAEQADPTPRRS
jgi:hypothetical protein